VLDFRITKCFLVDLPSGVSALNTTRYHPDSKRPPLQHPHSR